ncbi:MAG: tRNA uridine-5-carboxymethylaminomethyl(34) synthesis GTPase MnmE [Thermodesulfovibrionia bacterium]|nr:tRNA uridine-5-carboxymethylaminomethyl(34) synthesis GTPase MnmE [Thermodesulfovibrionia bacterium]
MHQEDTIAAISTPIGHGGIGIVRLSGPDALKIADKIFVSARKKKLANIKSHRIIYGHIVAPSTKETVDEVLVSVMKAPDTYTKENVVEINCHGGPVSVQRILELLLNAGARLADPGEFTRRAFLNGRIDLAQAEAVLDTINSLTEKSHKASLHQLEGKLSQTIGEIREEMLDLTANVEAYIDFPEDDIEPASKDELKKKAIKIGDRLKALIDSSRHGIILREGLKTAIIGRPNVGKSSLLNALLEKDRVIVTDIPGTTRDVIEEYLNIKGLPVKVLDTAGIRESHDLAEKEGVKRSLKAMKDAGLIILLLDGTEPLHETDKRLIKDTASKDVIIVINKTDRPLKIKLDMLPKDDPAVMISAIKGTGLSELKERIIEKALQGGSISGDALVTNIRHIKALQKASGSIRSFNAGLKKGLSPEFLSIELRDALDAIGEILGITTTEDILDRIFSSFCIGK